MGEESLFSISFTLAPPSFMYVIVKMRSFCWCFKHSRWIWTQPLVLHIGCASVCLSFSVALFTCHPSNYELKFKEFPTLSIIFFFFFLSFGLNSLVPSFFHIHIRFFSSFLLEIDSACELISLPFSFSFASSKRETTFDVISMVCTRNDGMQTMSRAKKVIS